MDGLGFRVQGLGLGRLLEKRFERTDLIWTLQLLLTLRHSFERVARGEATAKAKATMRNDDDDDDDDDDGVDHAAG